MKCEVANCRSDGSRSKLVLFYRFPRDPDISSKWAAVINKTKLNSKGKQLFVCSLHFPADAFIVSGNSICLKEDAVPTIVNRDGNYSNCPYYAIMKKRSHNGGNSAVYYATIKTPFSSDASVQTDRDTPIRVRKDLTNSRTAIIPDSDCKFSESKPIKGKRFRKHTLKKLELLNGKKARIVIRPKAYVLKPDGSYFETQMQTDIPGINSITPLVLDENDRSVDNLNSADIARIETDMRTIEVKKKTDQNLEISNILNGEDSDDCLENLRFNPSDEVINISGKTLSKLYDAFVKNKLLEIKLHNLKTRYEEQKRKTKLANQSLKRAKRRIKLYKIPAGEISAEEIEESE